MKTEVSLKENGLKPRTFLENLKTSMYMMLLQSIVFRDLEAWAAFGEITETMQYIREKF